MAKIDVISSSIVRMANHGHPIPMSRLELTPWDLLFLQRSHIHRGILFYKPTESQELEKNIIDHLKNSLSRTLDFFPPLAGRLSTIENKDCDTTCCLVDCNNAGVEFTHAVASDVSVSDILDAKYIPEIVPSFFQPEISKFLLGVQVTELVDGLFIGCTANHAVMDGASFWHFFNSWSEISRGFDKISKSPVFERDFPNNNRVISFPPIDSLPLLGRVFHFSKESVAKLKAKANSEAGSDKISSLQSLSAHLWRSVVRCRQNIRNKLSSQEVFIILSVDARARIPLPEGYFGNAVYFGKTVTSEAELLQNGLGYAGVKINELVAQQTSEAPIKYLEDLAKNPTQFRNGVGNAVFITSSPRHNVYGNDFGWGKPIGLRSGKGQQFDGNMMVSPAAEYGNLDVEVWLAPETMQAMQDDDEFMEAVTV
ncbi:hypothetical protein DH2020_042943 [Rehmannia glutinosa]|uniref:HXXXD-type acyl-transferase family protein n=1 Tax=Rehmannia glutinosa TaxID=99300 RepID=A0ABR0UL24_REHGL